MISPPPGIRRPSYNGAPAVSARSLSNHESLTLRRRSPVAPPRAESP